MGPVSKERKREGWGGRDGERKKGVYYSSGVNGTHVLWRSDSNLQGLIFFQQVGSEE